MPIVGTSSLENQVGHSVADARWGSGEEPLQESVLGVNGCASVKRERIHQELAEARAEKRVKVDGNGGLPGSSANGNGLDPTLLHRGIKDCQGTNPGSDLSIERDDLRPLVHGTVISVSAPKDTDLTDLLNDLDDAGDSDLDDDEFGDGSHMWPEALCDEWLGIGSISGNGVVAHMPEAEIIAKALNSSAELMHRDGVMGNVLQVRSPHAKPSTAALGSSSEQAPSNGDFGSIVQAHSSQPETITEAPGLLIEQTQRNGEIGFKVQAHSLQPDATSKAIGSSSEQFQRDDETEIVVLDGVRKENSAPLIVILDSDSEDDDDDDFIMYDHPVETSQLKNTVKVEPGAGKLEKCISQLKNAVKMEPANLRQPVRSCLLGNAAKVEPEILRQPERSHQLGNAVMAEQETLRQPGKSSQLGNAVKAEPETLRQPEKSSQLGNAVMVEQETLRQPEKSPQLGNAVMVEQETLRQPEKSSQLGNAVKAEPETLRQPEKSSQLGNAVKAEPETLSQPEKSSQLGNAVKVEQETLRQPEKSSQLGNAVKAEPETLRQPEKSSQLGNAVKAEPETLSQPEKSSQLGNAVKVEQETLRQPEKSSQLGHAVKLEPGNLRQPEKSPEFLPNETSQFVPNGISELVLNGISEFMPNEISESVPNEISEFVPNEISEFVPNEISEFVPNEISEFVPNEISEFVPNEISEFVPNEISECVPRESSHLTNVQTPELEIMRQVVDNWESQGFEAPTLQGVHRLGQEPRGILLETVVQHEKLMWDVVPQNPDTTLGSSYSVNRMDPTPPQVSHLPNGLRNGLPYGLPYGLPNGLPYGLGCSPGFAIRNVRESFYSGEQAGPSHDWIPTTTSADVPSYRGHTQPSGVGNGNHAIAGQAVVSVPRPSLPAGDVQDAAASREQAGPNHRWTPPNSSAVVPYRYDSTVSTSRVDVTRVLQQYLICINKAKDDSARASAERESTSNEPVKVGNRRGLDCRPDIVAYNEIKRANAGVNKGINVGDLPGVMVGDTFTYRHQMAIVGLHHLPNVGIDYGYPPPDMIPTATAIVMMPKAGYVDDHDGGETICYTGQGGRKKRNQQAPFVSDQILTKGNLALAKNHERKLPVRVIRGHFGIGDNGPGFLGYSEYSPTAGEGSHFGREATLCAGPSSGREANICTGTCCGDEANLYVG